MAQPQTYGTNEASNSSQTVDPTRNEGRPVAEDAKHQAGPVAGTAREQASGVANEAMSHAKNLAVDAKHQLHAQARQQTDALGGALGSFGGRIEALANGNVEEAGPIGDYARRLAGQVDQVASKVDEFGFDGMVAEVQRYARRRPAAFLLGAAAAGFAFSRLARGVQSAQDGTASQGRGSANGASATAIGTTGGASVGTPPPPPMPRSASPADPGIAASRAPDEFGRTGR